MNTYINKDDLFDDVWDLNDNRTDTINSSKQVTNNDTICENNGNWDDILDVYEEYKQPNISEPVSKLKTTEQISNPIKKKKKKKKEVIPIKKTYNSDDYDEYYDEYDKYAEYY